MSGYLTDYVVLLLLFCTSVLYAFVLQTRWARPWLEEKTWVSVVIGVGYTLAYFSLLVGGQCAKVAAICFAVSGTPIIARSLYNEMKRYLAMVERENGRGA